MTDLDEWQRTQHRANKLAADLAMWRLGRRYGWDIPHPSARIIMKANREITASYQLLAQSIARWFVPRYEALSRMFDGGAQ